MSETTRANQRDRASKVGALLSTALSNLVRCDSGALDQRQRQDALAQARRAVIEAREIVAAVRFGLRP
jgi:hypothetical protein